MVARIAYAALLTLALSVLLTPEGVTIPNDQFGADYTSVLGYLEGPWGEQEDWQYIDNVPLDWIDVSQEDGGQDQGTRKQVVSQ